MRKITTLMTVALMSLMLIGCDLIPPFYSLVRANSYSASGEYPKAIPFYEEAIAGFSKESDLEDLEYETRYAYAEMLTEHAKDDNSEYIASARTEFESVLEYEGNAENFSISKSLVVFSIAYTYHVESLYLEDDDEYFQALESAYSYYMEAAEELEKAEDWQSLSIIAYNIGEVADWYGDIDEAISWMSRAVQLDKEHGFDEDLKEDQAYLDELQLRKLEVAETTNP